ncbi:MAG: CUB domain-containing protein [Bacteroidia bacterium]|nr:S8 family serine peptidase [Bacteroidia bacterium]MDW8158770.1 CUB domain-containing protein [Bacteroidia bacterium]
MKKISMLFLALGIIWSNTSLAQPQSVSSTILKETNVTALKRISSSLKIQEISQKNNAVSRAAIHQWPTRVRLTNGNVLELIRLDKRGRPVYFLTANRDAAHTISTSRVWPGGQDRLDLTGEGYKLAMWDGGGVRTTHQEFQGRVVQKDYTPEVTDHATHVAGTLVAAGIDPSAQGMAYKAQLHAYDFNNVGSELVEALSEGILISNHSYGAATGWVKFQLPNGSESWAWFGDPSISPSTDYRFGFYDEQAQSIDEFLRLAPYHLFVIGAGNDRGESGPPPGEPYFIIDPRTGNFSTSTEPRNPDGPYDCINSLATAKNVLTVGAIDDLPQGYRLPQLVRMTEFSSWGPTDDGRIKPDIVANGESIYSTWGSSDNSYRVESGSSFATPSVTGSLLLLQELHSKKYGAPMKANTLKALAIHTADEAGNFPGPDYEFGHGVLNISKAAEVINNTGLDHLITEGTLEEGQTIRIRVRSNGFRSLWATLAWTDPAGIPVSPQLNPTNLMLINDLDIRIEGNGVTYSPWVLNPAFPSYPATTGDNFRDNVEKVWIANPMPGDYTIIIRHKGKLQGGYQNFALIVSGITGAYDFCSGTTRLTSFAGSFNDGSGNNNYADNTRCYWLIQPEGAQSIELNFISFQTERFRDVVNVYDGPTTSSPLLGTFSGNALPPVLRSSSGAMLVEFITDDKINAAGWNAVYTSFVPQFNFCSGETILTAPSGSFSDGSGIEDYRPGTLCKWLIQPPQAEAITLNFSSFNINEQDQVFIFDGPSTTSPLIGAYTGNQIPPTITSSGGSLLVYFVVRSAQGGNGWSANYQISCKKPTNLSTEVGRVSSHLRWSPINGAIAYIVEYRDWNSSSWTSLITSTAHAHLTGLKTSTGYEWRVRAVCADNAPTAWSEPARFTTEADVFCGPPILLRLQNLTVNDAVITWQGSPNAIEYEVYWSEVGAPIEKKIITNISQVLLTNLVGGTSYVVRVRSLCGEGIASDFSGVIEFRTLEGCSYPLNLSVEPGPTPTSVTARWNPVIDANRYIVAFRVDRNDAIWTNVNISTNSLFYIVDNLIPGEIYSIRIRSRCNAYGSAWSPEVKFNNNGIIQKSWPSANQATSITVYPNPTQGVFTALYHSNEQQTLHAVITDLTGREVSQRTLEAIEGVNEFSWDISSVPKGWYLLKIFGHTINTTVKIRVD